MIGDNIETIVRKWGMKQSAFANLFHKMNPQKISSYVTGRALPSVEFILRLEDLTGISARQLYRERIDISRIPPAPLSSEQSTLQVDSVNDKDKFKSLEYRVMNLEKEVAELRGKPE